MDLPDDEPPSPNPETLTFPPVPSQARHVRAAVTRLLTRWRLPELIDEAALLSSEVFTNAITHAKDETVLVEVVIRPVDHGIRFEFADGSTKLPDQRLCAPDEDEDGRGLALVQALARDWGTRQRAHGKAVWFELTQPA